MKTATKKSTTKKYEDEICVKYLDLITDQIKDSLKIEAENITEKEQLRYARSVEIISEIMSSNAMQMELVSNGEYKTKSGSDRFNNLTSIANNHKLELIQLVTQF